MNKELDIDNLIHSKIHSSFLCELERKIYSTSLNNTVDFIRKTNKVRSRVNDIVGYEIQFEIIDQIVLKEKL